MNTRNIETDIINTLRSLAADGSDAAAALLAEHAQIPRTGKKHFMTWLEWMKKAMLFIGD